MGNKVLDVITAYLAMGVFNPETVKQDRVRDLIMSARDEIIRLEGEVIQWKGYAETLQGIIEQKQPNLNPVPVLADAENRRTGSPSFASDVSRSAEVGEARESTSAKAIPAHGNEDSRGGIQKLFLGQTP